MTTVEQGLQDQLDNLKLAQKVRERLGFWPTFHWYLLDTNGRLPLGAHGVQLFEDIPEMRGYTVCGCGVDDTDIHIRTGLLEAAMKLPIREPLEQEVSD